MVMVFDSPSSKSNVIEGGSISSHVQVLSRFQLGVDLGYKRFEFQSSFSPIEP